MPKLLTVVTLFSAFSFMFYGVSCLTSKRMALDFDRFKLTTSQRQLTGILQLVGGMGLAIGYYTSPILAAVSAIGLAILMIMGFIIRLKIKDSLVLSAPALMYALLNIYLAIRFLDSHIR